MSTPMTNCSYVVIQYNTIQSAVLKVGKNQTIITQALVNF
jgi:hypothetical protein